MTDDLRVSETQLLDALHRITAATSVGNVESLRSLLTYLVRQSIERPGEPIRENRIASEVFGKSENFDPRQDSTVRVQISRLRSKLNKYYQSDGTSDPWILDIPKGSYAVAIRRREILPEPLPVPPAPSARAPLSPWIYAAAGFLAGCLLTWAVLQNTRAL